MQPARVLALGKPALRRTIRHALVGGARSPGRRGAGRFTRADADRLLDEAWARFGELARDLPAEPTLGARQNVLLAALTLAFFRALTDDGVERTYAIGPPAYVFEDRPEPNGRALDMLHCPVADYMRREGAGDLCVGTWCNLDFPLAELWGGRLERHGSLAAGDPRCDFRFVVAAGRRARSSASI